LKHQSVLIFMDRSRSSDATKFNDFCWFFAESSGWDLSFYICASVIMCVLDYISYQNFSESHMFSDICTHLLSWFISSTFLKKSLMSVINYYVGFPYLFRWVAMWSDYVIGQSEWSCKRPQFWCRKARQAQDWWRLVRRNCSADTKQRTSIQWLEGAWCTDRTKAPERKIQAIRYRRAQSRQHVLRWISTPSSAKCFVLEHRELELIPIIIVHINASASFRDWSP
jgi:hypothetical protein